MYLPPRIMGALLSLFHHIRNYRVVSRDFTSRLVLISIHGSRRSGAIRNLTLSMFKSLRAVHYRLFEDTLIEAAVAVSM
jgi:hypothetical protein